MDRRSLRTAEERKSNMTTKVVRRVMRPQNFLAILGMGVLSVASFGLVLGALPASVELFAAALGLAGGTAVVLRDR